MNDFWTEEAQRQRKKSILKIILIIFLILISISIIVLFIVYNNKLEFRMWVDENIWTKEIKQDSAKSIELEDNSNSQVYAYDKYICILKNKKIEIYNKIGTSIGKIDIDINNAIFTSSGRYMAIAEKDGQKFYLINGKEKIFENSIEGNISHIKVNRSGYVSVVVSNTTYKSIVDVYDKSGKEIFKTNLVTSTVVDVALSDDSKYLAIAEVDLSGILIRSIIKTISIEIAQENPDKAIINTYEATTDKMIMNVEYQEKNKLICMYNDNIESLEGEKSTEILNYENKKIAFCTIEINNRIAILEEISTGDYTANTNIKIINPIDLKEKPYLIKDVAKSIYTYENKIIINLGTELYVINRDGILLSKYVSDTEINDIVMTDSLVGIIYRNEIRIINL